MKRKSVLQFILIATSAWLTLNASTTYAGPEDSFKFIVFGDMNGGGCERNQRVASIVADMAQEEDIAFYVSTGDIIDGYLNGDGETMCYASDPSTDAEAQAAACVPEGNIADLLSPIKDRAPVDGLAASFYLTLGNHDGNWGGWYPDPCGDGICDFLSPLTPDTYINHSHGDICSKTQAESALPDDFYYSFTYKNSYFIVLRINDDYSTMISVCNGHPGYADCLSYCSEPSLLDDPTRNNYCYNDGGQYKWFLNELENAKNYDNVFVFSHAPALADENHGDDHAPYSGADIIRTIVEDAGVDIYFNGHNHGYERSHPVKGDSVANSGTVYITTGTAGATYEYNVDNWYTAASYRNWITSDMSNKQERHASYMVITIDGNQLTGEVFSPYTQATPVDSFVLDGVSDDEPPSTPQNLTGEVVSSSQITLAWNSSSDNDQVTGYRIYRDGSEVDTTSETQFTDTDLTKLTTYSYTIAAYDPSGNESDPSTPLLLTTAAGDTQSGAPLADIDGSCSIDLADMIKSLQVGTGQQVTGLMAGNGKIGVTNAIFIARILASLEAKPPLTCIGGCPIFPADNMWNSPIDELEVHSLSDTYLETIGLDLGLHPDFGTTWNGIDIGIPYELIPDNQPFVDVRFLYWEETDPLEVQDPVKEYPLPEFPSIEGGGGNYIDNGDNHVLLIREDSCILYELYDVKKEINTDQWTAGSGAIWNLRLNEVREEGVTSADAAGLAILPGLVKYEEVFGDPAQNIEPGIHHAIRVTLNRIQSAYIKPASHSDGTVGQDRSYPPMGLRLRLKADYDISGFDEPIQVILTALKKYGLVIADTGGDMFVSGMHHDDWSDDQLRQLSDIKVSDFEAVYTGEIIDY